jgi:hypothetical protein
MKNSFLRCYVDGEGMFGGGPIGHRNEDFEPGTTGGRL